MKKCAMDNLLRLPINEQCGCESSVQCRKRKNYLKFLNPKPNSSKINYIWEK